MLLDPSSNTGDNVCAQKGNGLMERWGRHMATTVESGSSTRSYVNPCDKTASVPLIGCLMLTLASACSPRPFSCPTPFGGQASRECIAREVGAQGNVEAAEQVLKRNGFKKALRQPSGIYSFVLRDNSLYNITVVVSYRSDHGRVSGLVVE